MSHLNFWSEGEGKFFIIMLMVEVTGLPGKLTRPTIPLQPDKMRLKDIFNPPSPLTCN